MKKTIYKNESDRWYKYGKPRYHTLKKVREAHKVKQAKWLEKLKKNKKAYAIFRENKLRYLVNYRLKQKNDRSNNN